MVIKNTANSLLVNFCLDGHLDREILNKYQYKQNPKNLRICLEELFNIDLDDIEKLVYNIFDSWKKKDDVWNDTELVIFRYLLRSNGVGTLSELKTKSRLEINQVRDAVKGLEESEISCDP